MRGAPAPFPWDEAIGLGLGVLRLTPEAFWKTTPRELALALRALGIGASAPISRAAFDDLMRRHPDG
ncbi:phage tail assembly chaperone [Rhodoplanes sp. TEM]|uniref:Phage tail assembly chaperone n=1 Tax=Rhodoplanes tepidamans TaxID=200616 RepID=A0ABT5JG58_RHOTP|nr:MULTISPECIES: rcc01693 family protein [Rhodoplanes]MDC7788694.1 phage tail assembly chaperone [Rhodoplanes tepidamans]MDC7987620.1 phage tail assembly chaperone [Rhodoplanes sp. TEM]MDQ0358302.1 putative phage protein (TIGR02216 family) [Rhodoplanes tepidamans]